MFVQVRERLLCAYCVTINKQTNTCAHPANQCTHSRFFITHTYTHTHTHANVMTPGITEREKKKERARARDKKGEDRVERKRDKNKE